MESESGNKTGEAWKEVLRCFVAFFVPFCGIFKKSRWDFKVFETTFVTIEKFTALAREFHVKVHEKTPDIFVV